MNLRLHSDPAVEAHLAANAPDVLRVLTWAAKRTTSIDPETQRHARKARALLKAIPDGRKEPS